MKTRIKEWSNEAGSSEFYPQYKKFIFWKYFFEVDEILLDISNGRYGDNETVYFYDLEEAEDFLKTKLQ